MQSITQIMTDTGETEQKEVGRSAHGTLSLSLTQRGISFSQVTFHVQRHRMGGGRLHRRGAEGGHSLSCELSHLLPSLSRSSARCCWLAHHVCCVINRNLPYPFLPLDTQIPLNITILRMQNSTGGWATCEKTRGGKYFEYFNARSLSLFILTENWMFSQRSVWRNHDWLWLCRMHIVRSSSALSLIAYSLEESKLANFFYFLFHTQIHTFRL